MAAELYFQDNILQKAISAISTEKTGEQFSGLYS